MSAYWRSPYKELCLDTSSHISSIESLHSASTSKKSLVVSPQDWFEWALPSSKHYHQQALRRTGGKIKGILKTSRDTADATSDKGATASSSDLRHSNEEDSMSLTKKGKKKVTFGSPGGGHKNSAEFQSQIIPLRCVSAHHQRFYHRQPAVEDFDRHNLKKLLNNVPGTPPLPSVSGKKMTIPKKEKERPIYSSSSTCRHSSDLRCAQCLKSFSQEVNKDDKDINTEKTRKDDLDYLHELDEMLVKTSRNGRMSETPRDGHTSSEFVNLQPDSRSRNEATKLNGINNDHWTKTFIKSPDKRHQVRHLAGRYPFNAGMIHPRIVTRQGEAQLLLASPSGLYTRNGVIKLKLRADGKVMDGTTGEVCVKDSKPSPRRQGRRPESDRSHASRASSGHFGYKVPATCLKFPDNEDKDESGLQIKTKNKQNQRANVYCMSAGGVSDSVSEVHVNKTSQILSWLNDVQRKQNYQPRNSRLYGVSQQQLY